MIHPPEDRRTSLTSAPAHLMSNPMEKEFGGVSETWFRVGKFGGDIRSKAFERSTEHFLFYDGGRRRDRKSTSFERWYPTLPEAEDAARAITDRGNARVADQRIRNAAHELLAACEAVVASGMRNAAYDACVAAVAKARGQS